MRVEFFNEREPIEIDTKAGANLSGADLGYSGLACTNLRHVDLRGANLDYSCLPLSCKSLHCQVDKRLAVQLLYHACRWLETVEDDECQKFVQMPEVQALVNQFHRVKECGEI